MRVFIIILSSLLILSCSKTNFDYNNCLNMNCSLATKIKKLKTKAQGLSSQQICDLIDDTEVAIVSHNTDGYNVGVYTCQLNKDILDFDTIHNIVQFK